MSSNEIRNLNDEIRPISMWGYLGYQILFAIPLVGFIMLLVCALGGSRNVNVRNFARSYFCVAIIVVVIVALMAMSGVGYGLLSQM